MSIGGTARGIMKACQTESCMQFKTARLLLLRDGDGGDGVRRYMTKNNALAGRRRFIPLSVPLFCAEWERMMAYTPAVGNLQQHIGMASRAKGAVGDAIREIARL